MLKIPAQILLLYDELLIKTAELFCLGSDQAMLLRFIGYPSKNRCFRVLKHHFQG